MRRLLLSLRGALCALLFAGCGDDVPPPVPTVAPQGDLPFAFVDVAGSMGYTMRNRTGKEGSKEFILEAMPPGIAVADFDGDGDMDMFCPNGNDIWTYDRRTRAVTLLPPEDAPENELYLNEGGKRFRAAGHEAGVADQLWSFGAVAGDLDNDGDKDLYVCNWGPNRLYVNHGDATFDEVAGRIGAAGDPIGWSTGASLFDYDRDGDLDIYVAQYADMYSYFDDRSQCTIDEEGHPHGRTCEWKKLKVYCGPTGLVPQNDLLLKNMLMETGQLRFEDVTREMGMLFPYDDRSTTESSVGPFYGFVPVSWDIDEDGWPDLFVANDSQANCCWMNQKGKGFVNAAAEMGLGMSQDDFKAQASMGVAVGDLNNDGLLDFVVSEFSHDQFNLLVAERLNNGLVVFGEKASRTGMRDMTFTKLGWGATFLDADLDGDQDIFFCCGHVSPEVDQPIFRDQNTPYRQTNLLLLNRDPARLKLEDVSARAGPGLQIRKASRAAVAIDFDDDGDLDIATTELNDSPSLLRCDLDHTRAPHHWLKVLLKGNPAAGVPLDPAGAVVKVTAGDLVMHRVLLLGSSFQSSEDPRLHFGLGTHDRADAIEVRWPGGATTRVENVPGDQMVTITCPDR